VPTLPDNRLLRSLILGRGNIDESAVKGRTNASARAQPNAKRFTVRRVLGAGDLWVSELVMTYDGKPSYVVSIMEFEAGEVVRESQYFSDPFEPGPSRAQWVEPID
jgi:hypothetical protein